MKVLAIDPGTTQSAMVLMDSETLKPEQTWLVDNDKALEIIFEYPKCRVDRAVIEMVASYGMPVGKEVFETVLWIGRFYQTLKFRMWHEPELIYRKEEKLHICDSTRANDATIRRALIDRFATHDFRTGRGTKKDPDFFAGFKADMWAAYAVGLTYIETKLKKEP